MLTNLLLPWMEEEGLIFATSSDMHDSPMGKMEWRGTEALAHPNAALAYESIYPAANDVRSQIFEIIDRAWIELNMKETIYSALNSCDEEEFLSRLFAMDIPEVLKDAIREVQW